MSERYSRLFLLPENLYATGAPILVAAGTLLQDNETGKVLAQLKLRNLDARTVKAAKVVIRPKDTAGNPLGDCVQFQYLDQHAGRDRDFGAKTPVFLPDTATRAYSVAVTEVVFVDGSVWSDAEQLWEPLSAPQPLEYGLQESELVKQYRQKFGGSSKFMPAVQKDLWICTCGSWNHETEAICHSCKKPAAAMMNLDLDGLKAERDARLEMERQKAAEAQAAAAEAAKKNKKRMMILAPIAVAVLIVAILISNAVKAKKVEEARLRKYTVAVDLQKQGQIDGPIALFTELGDYQDSAERLALLQTVKEEAEKAATYDSAMEAIANGDDDLAYDLFQQLGDYKDAADYEFIYLLQNKFWINESTNSQSATGYTYDNLGRLTRSVTAATASSSKQEITEFSYDAAGKQFGRCEDYWMYDKNFRPIEEYPSVTTMEYNEHGDILTRHIEQDHIQKDGTRISEKIYDYVYTYEYNDDGTMAKMTYLITADLLQSDGTRKVTTTEYERTYEYEYDAEGKVISSVEHNGNAETLTEYAYDENGNLATARSGKSKTTYQYIRKLTKVD